MRLSMRLQHLLATCMLLALTAVHSSTSVSAAVTISGSSDTPKRLKTLVLLDDQKYKQSHSKLFRDIEEHGHDLTYHHIYDDNIPALQTYDEVLFDNLLLLAPTAPFFDLNDKITVDTITNFVDSGRNVLIAYNQHVSEPYRQLANEYDLKIDDADSHVEDSKYRVQSGIAGDNVIAFPPTTVNQNITKDIASNVLYSGVGTINLAINRRIIPILRGTSTTKSVSGSKTLSQGLNTLLITGIQTPHNSRLLFCGSIDALSDSYADAKSLKLAGGENIKATANRVLTSHIVEWAFGQRNVLRAVNLKHTRIVNDTRAVIRGKDTNVVTGFTSYRVKDYVQFGIDIEQYSSKTQSWQPYVSSDIQLQLAMLDPYYRIYLPHQQNGHYNITLQLPDTMGIYKWMIDYHRQGYSHIFVNDTISVRPYRHDEYERFLFVAYPYYITAFSLMTAFVLFGVIFLYQPSDRVGSLSGATSITSSGTVTQTTVTQNTVTTSKAAVDKAKLT